MKEKDLGLKDDGYNKLSHVFLLCSTNFAFLWYYDFLLKAAQKSVIVG